jgi:hypothetical protein
MWRHLHDCADAVRRIPQVLDERFPFLENRQRPLSAAADTSNGTSSSGINSSGADPQSPAATPVESSARAGAAPARR